MQTRTKAELDAIAARYLVMPDRQLDELYRDALVVAWRDSVDAMIGRKDSAFSPALPAPGCR